MADRLDELLTIAAVEHLGEDAGLGPITAQVELYKAASDLLAALERSHQYVVLQLRDARQDKRLSPGTIRTAERDLEMVDAAIAKALED